MKLNGPFNILVLILALSLTGGMVPQVFGDCDSPCCGSESGYPNPRHSVQDLCNHFHVFIKEIKSTSCKMNKFPSSDGTQGACLTASRVQRPAPSVHTVLYCELSPFSNLSAGPVRRPYSDARAAPELLYLENLTLLI